MKEIQCPHCELLDQVPADKLVHRCAGCERTIRAEPPVVIKPKAKTKRKK